MSPPKESTKAASTTTSPVQPNAEAPKPIDSNLKADDLGKVEATNAEPLAPPPRPAVANTPDYFSGNHGLSHETNPFEYSFAGGSSAGGQVQTPGGTKLPSVAALTSPALPFWGTSAGLRSGPLSPAMLAGPAKDDYFGDGHHLRGGFPTPNESGLRSGLTPGGGGSMFPEPSPNTQNLFNSLQSGGATPNTLDFHRTAMNARQKANEVAQHAKITSQPQDPMNGLDVKPPPQARPFDETNDAANGLYLLAQAHNGPQQTNHYAIAPQAIIHAHPQQMQMGGQSQDTSPHMDNRNGGSISTNSGRGVSEMSGMSEDEQHNRPHTRGKGKRPSPQDNQVNGGRKASGQPAKAPANKKAKGNNGNAMRMSMEPPSENEEEHDMSKDEYNANGKKMTDDEKRKNFLERNRVAALKCRQRKKQWLANLQQKVEMYSVENESLSQTVSQLREELVNLKTLLLAHKDCPVSHSQGLSNGGIQQIVEGTYGNPHMNPYGMAAAMNNQHQQQMMAQGFQRRES